ncbi:triosephosphate isomerase [Faunimonas pinastri]|uniref:Triosephosphate isomerase n=1 Tax=Faunimonas pinastri TaxID=1855383 RepID=A0A1H9N8N4_9HYPH|nr:triose-phosphate isomerase [Faunimonas pinastri]SER32346.1 triosephosphate isomerase [Faunimonas pinastri]
MRKLIIGNWKMNGLSSDLDEIGKIAEGIAEFSDRVEVMLCPPMTLLERAAARCRGSDLKFCGQNCHFDPRGSHTGEVSAEMLADAGASAVLVGHSERRIDSSEDHDMVRLKAEAARRANIIPIICIGESEHERESGYPVETVMYSLRVSVPDGSPSHVVVGYEPAWAIGTGRTPMEDDIATMHAHIRRGLIDRFGESGRLVRVLYGGSLNLKNADGILAIPDVDGGLVGGASLKAESFLAVIAAAANVASLQSARSVV